MSTTAILRRKYTYVLQYVSQEHCRPVCNRFSKLTRTSEERTSLSASMLLYLQDEDNRTDEHDCFLR